MKRYDFPLMMILLGIVAVVTLPTAAAANILGQHAFTWWDDPLAPGVVVTPVGAQPPSPAAVALFDLEEWHLDQAQTTQYYNGVNLGGGLPLSPFNLANRSVTPQYPQGLIGNIAPVAGAEAFIYRLTNTGYQAGNGPFGGPPFTFTDPFPPGPGSNDLSGINIADTHNALANTAPAPGSQFMFTSTIPFGQVLDMTPGSLIQPHDWDFNAFGGPGNFEWDISVNAGSGVVAGLPPAVFGFAMPGNWQDAVNNGHVHSWNFPAVGPSFQVNLAFGTGGFSGPQPFGVIPEPSTFALTTLGLLSLGLAGWRRRRR